ncbi:MAG: adenylate/guanylate cyclase domain-containing protein [Byssovorax sp.]
MLHEHERARWDTVCHDLRTPLSIILGYSDMLIEDTEELPAWKTRAADVRRVREAGQALLARLDAAMSASRREGRSESFLIASTRLHGDLRGPLDEVLLSMDRLHEETLATAESGELLVDLDRIRTAGRRFDALMLELLPLPSASAPADATPLPGSKPSWLPPPLPDVARPDSVPPPGSIRAVTGKLLVVDDNESNRAVLSQRLTRQGHTVSAAAGGREALELLSRELFDLVLLDVMMPDMDGYQVLEKMKSDEVLRHLPVVMISARGDLDGMVRCLELGAEDYLAKPFNPVLLRARIGASLAQKQQRDRERFYVEQLRAAQEQSETLLLNVLPKAIADRLKLGESAIADYFPAVTVLFADLVGFTAYAARLAPATVVLRLNEIFSAFDQLAERHGVEKIKTIGDAYLAVGGLPVPRDDHAEAIAELALDMQIEVDRFNQRSGESIVIRTGIHSGPVVAGIIGIKKFTYDLWGDTVNTASRMESHGVPGAIQISETTRLLLDGKYLLTPRGIIDVKGKGLMETALLVGRK